MSNSRVLTRVAALQLMAAAEEKSQSKGDIKLFCGGHEYYKYRPEYGEWWYGRKGSRDSGRANYEKVVEFFQKSYPAVCKEYGIKLEDALKGDNNYEQ